MNKFSISLLAFYLILKAAVAQTLDANGVPISAGTPVNLSTPSEVSISSLSFGNSRRLTEINEVGQADAFPCLSNDGLRVYFTKGDFNIYSTVRNPSDNTFSPPVLVFDYTSDLYGCTISADEKTLITTTHIPSKLIKATRLNLNDMFNFQSEIQLNPSPSAFYSPSFSPDSSELFLCKAPGNSSYSRTGNNSYSFNSDLPTLSIPQGPGKLSADGLDFFHSSSNVNNDLNIYQWSRSSLNGPFTGAPQLVPVNGFSGSPLILSQPAISVDKSFTVFVISDGLWTGNDLAIAFNTTTGTENILNTNSFTISPNPASGSFRISGMDGGEAFTFLNIHGQTVHSGHIPENGSVSISSLASGIYTLRMLKNNQWVHEKVVKE
jgi:hypothetical protein